MRLETIISSRPIILAQAAITEVKAIVNKIVTTALARIKAIQAMFEQHNASLTTEDLNAVDDSDDSALDADTEEVNIQDTSSSTKDLNALIDSADVTLKNLEALKAQIQSNEIENVNAVDDDDDSALDADTEEVSIQDTSSSTKDLNALIDSADVTLKNLEALNQQIQSNEIENVNAVDDGDDSALDGLKELFAQDDDKEEVDIENASSSTNKVEEIDDSALDGLQALFAQDDDKEEVDIENASSSTNKVEEIDDSALDGLQALFAQNNDKEEVDIENAPSSTENFNALIASSDVIRKNLEALLARFQYDETKDVDADIDMDEIPQ